MRLNEMQRGFKESITDEAPEDFLRIFKSASVSVENRMKVYRNNVMRSLTNAVTVVYPLTEKLVGVDFLAQAVRKYVTANPPDQGNLNFYGATFPDFIRDYEPARNLPYLYDMTRLEWAWETATLATDDEKLDPARLQGIPEDRIPYLRFTLRDSVRLIRSQYPLDKIVDFCRAETQDGTLDIGGIETHLMVIRPELQTQMRKLGKGEWILLTELRDRRTLLDAAEKAMEADETFNLAAILQKHLELGTFTEIA
jgi:hypothetical protein